MLMNRVVVFSCVSFFRLFCCFALIQLLSYQPDRLVLNKNGKNPTLVMFDLYIYVLIYYSKDINFKILHSRIFLHMVFT